MLTLNDKISLLVKLGAYLEADTEEWQEVKRRAVNANGWFTIEHINIAVNNIVQAFLQKDKLEQWVHSYTLPVTSLKVGVVAAGNIPLVCFHDVLCVFLSGHQLFLKLSSKDNVLFSHILRLLISWNESVSEYIHLAELLRDCHAYIATGSNNSARYFEQYFSKYPHVIRKNRTSVAILDGTETDAELDLLADDVFCYYGLGCRNVTQVCVPPHYDFQPLMKALARYKHFADHHKYKNNYDYHLALYLLNRVPYLTNESVLLVENEMAFSAVSVLHYRYYAGKATLLEGLQESEQIQCIVGHGHIPFGQSQQPSLSDYADGVDTMNFVCSL